MTETTDVCPSCGHSVAEHGESRVVGCSHGDGSDANPICGCRLLASEIVQQPTPDLLAEADAEYRRALERTGQFDEALDAAVDQKQRADAAEARVRELEGELVQRAENKRDENYVWEEGKRAGLKAAEAREDKLRKAIIVHRSQRADDRCIEDDDELYEALGDGIKCDRRVGDKEAMYANCRRFIDNRCEAGGWLSYRELEARVKELENQLELSKDPMLIDEDRWLEERNAGADSLAKKLLEDDGRGVMGGELCRKAQARWRELIAAENMVVELVEALEQLQDATNNEHYAPGGGRPREFWDKAHADARTALVRARDAKGGGR